VRASRLVSILLLLQTHGHMTAQQLADLLAVSVLTIYRDIDSLKCVYMAIMILDPTGTGQRRWSIRWKPASTPSTSPSTAGSRPAAGRSPTTRVTPLV
jgi:DNA binding protein with HTH domain